MEDRRRSTTVTRKDIASRVSRPPTTKTSQEKPKNITMRRMMKVTTSSSMAKRDLSARMQHHLSKVAMLMVNSMLERARRKDITTKSITLVTPTLVKEVLDPRNTLVAGRYMVLIMVWTNKACLDIMSPRDYSIIILIIHLFTEVFTRNNSGCKYFR